MEEEHIIHKMELYIKDNIKTIKRVVMEELQILMEVFMRVIGKMVKHTELVNLYIMETIRQPFPLLLENLSLEKEMVKENLFGLMVLLTMVILKII